MREKITSAVFSLCLFLFFLLVMVFPKDEKASIQENRPLFEMPKADFNSIFFGNFTADYEKFLTDNVGFRSNFVNLGNKIEKMQGIQAETSEGIVELNNGGKLVLSKGKIMEVFSENLEALNKYVDVLNEYAETMNKTNMYSMVVPTQIEFNETEYKTLSDSEKSTIDKIYSSLKGFKTVNVYDKLKESKDKYIYFRTDHHWTQRGAYLGYMSLMEKAGEKPVLLEDLTHQTQNGFLGYLYNQANVPEYNKYADDIEYFEGQENYLINAKGPDENGKIVNYVSRIYCPPDNNVAPKYSIFMGGDHAFAEINTNNNNGKTALVIKDSYANAVVPLLTNNYKTIIIIDPRNYYGTITDLRNNYKIDDCFFINYVFTTTFSDYIDNLIRIK